MNNQDQKATSLISTHPTIYLREIWWKKTGIFIKIHFSLVYRGLVCEDLQSEDTTIIE